MNAKLPNLPAATVDMSTLHNALMKGSSPEEAVAKAVAEYAPKPAPAAKAPASGSTTAKTKTTATASAAASK